MLNFAFVTTVLTLSRLYLGCHFLHQCVVGLLLGVLVGLLVLRPKFNALIFSIKNRQITLISAIFVFGALSVYWVQKMFNVDPLWSIKLVSKYFFLF
jgi:glucose-6-phosphatase